MKLKHFSLLGIGLYLLLSAADFVLTFALLKTTRGVIYEANPVAAACLDQYGWGGLALFKLGGVAAFVGAVALLQFRRPAVAAVMTAVGCAVLLSVTTYSHHALGEVRRAHAELRVPLGTDPAAHTLGRQFGPSHLHYDPDTDPLIDMIPTP